MSESVSYLDVGLKLEVEPVVYLEDEVGITMGLEVSNIVREVRGSVTNIIGSECSPSGSSSTLRTRVWRRA